MSRHRILFVLSRGPHSGSLAQDCLDAALTAALLDQSVVLLFSGDGVFQLLEPEAAGSIGSLSQFAPVEIVAVREDMRERQLTSAQLADELSAGIKLVDASETAALFEQCDRVLSF